jgi:hypothetical protein
MRRPNRFIRGAPLFRGGVCAKQRNSGLDERETPRLWVRGYWVSTVGHNEAAVRKYIQEQEKEDQRLDQLGLFAGQSRFERFTIICLTDKSVRTILTPSYENGRMAWILPG